ncbi:MAG: pteridine reductase [Alcanivoracaceae bacterium]|nr:pteridine reductase [Alcanivoracaceae bacterium]
MVLYKKVMLITGAAQRIGAHIAQSAHADDYNIVLHYRQSLKQTQELKEQLNNIRLNSCISVQADFNNEIDFKRIINIISSEFGRLDVLVNNASEFFPTNLSELRPLDYDKLFNSNVKGPLFLSKACYHLLKKVNGSIINLVDIHADKPLKGYPIYSMAKAANKMMVQALAKEYAPEIRVNGISPGCIIWPATGLTDIDKDSIINRTVLKRKGQLKNIYKTIQFLIENDFITGHTVNVDGGRSLNM